MKVSVQVGSRSSRRFLPDAFIGIAVLASLISGAAPVHGAQVHAAQNIGDELGLNPRWNWKRIETENFRIDFPEELTDVAQKSANYFEQAHAVLTPILQWEPRARAQVILVDNADAANGMATPVLRFGIVLMTTPPDPFFTTNDYDDWLKLVILHEYTHFLNMDATRGIWSPLREVFGDVLLPNAIWPSWMLEGLAVYMETRFTDAGRGRSAYYDMVLRAAADAGVLGKPEFVSLDRVNGTNPYFPGGETAYLFGYQLMNRVAAGAPERLSEGRILGTLSAQSSQRVPFFVNMNIEDVSGQNWYQYWDEWVEDSRLRMAHQLARIRMQGETRPEILTEDGYQVLGPVVSKDGRFVAYTMETLTKRMGLYLRDTQTGETTRLSDKRLGSQLAFSPASRFIFFSSLETQSVYSQFSDLFYYDLEKKKGVRLTDGLRARDPDASPDGKSLVFTLTKKAVTGLAIADLEEIDGELVLGEPRLLFMPAQYDRVANPRFSSDGHNIYFSLHRSGKAGSTLEELELGKDTPRTLVSDGHVNRFPAVGPNGDVYYVSDATGVDNVYRLKRDTSGTVPADLVTNMATGIHFPALSSTEPDLLYASVFTHTGSKLARVPLASKPVERSAVTLLPPPAPMTVAVPAAEEEKIYPIGDYSVFPSIWPRQWFPVLYLEPREVYVGAQLLGFDAVDRHRYVLGVAYDSQIKKMDYFALYTNRSLGPSITVAAENNTRAIYLRQPVLDFVRRTRISGMVSYPFRRTYSVLVPALAMELDRSHEYQRAEGSSFDQRVFSFPYVPHFDLRLAYSNSESSRLAVETEGGRQAFGGTRVYLDSGGPTWKGLLTDSEYVRLWDHVVWNPSVKLTWTSRTSGFVDANAVVQGRSMRVVDPFPSDDFDQLALRGYPRQAYFSRMAGVIAQDLVFPVSQIFRGWGTNPVFLEQLSGFVFTEAAYFPGSEFGVTTLPSAGTGLRLSSEVLLRVPLNVSLEYHRGFRKEFGGKSEVLVTLGLGALPF
ncbi:MAG: hypothetical protein A2X94_04235 [Bdellovibrionales bacterium GWB1_55_8]|nr:MAG: hypothetical protein A2X94_04235 [Bdellovibrionales bacterium GWB1_55_8]